MARTLGELIARLTHTDVQHQLFDPDFPHRVLLLGLWLLGDLLGHVVAKIYRLNIIN
jgi:hypothetical protein